MTIQEIHQALEQGITVYWENSLYELEYVQAEESNEYAKPSYKNGKAIRITCTRNGFGSLMSPTCASKCYIK